MDVIEAIKTRRTAHFYSDKPVPEAYLREALECAIRAPNHKLTNPWRFTRVGPETRARLVDLAVSVKRSSGPVTEAQERKVREKVGSSPELLVVRQVLADDELRRREDYAACACALQNMMLALCSRGVQSKWSTGGATRAPEAYEICGIDAEAEEIIGFLFVGYSDHQPDTPRTAVDSVVDTLA